MKSAALLLLISIFILPLFANSDPDTDFVYDINGNKLEPNVDYYIVPFLSRVGGLTPGTGRGYNGCPWDVIQIRSDVSHGVSVKFFPVNPEDKFIRASTDVNIRFSQFIPSCKEGLVWKLDEYDSKRENFFVTTNGTLGNPGCATFNNWFQIKKQGDAYKFVFCPSVCDIHPVVCRDIDTFFDPDSTLIRLVLSKEAYPFVFVKETGIHQLESVA